MLPFIKLTDDLIVLRAFEFGEAPALLAAVRESLRELKPWMSWANEEYSLDTANNFITITRANWSSGIMYAFAIADASSNEILGGCSLSHFHPIYAFCNLGYWVRTSQQGQGLAGRAAKLAARFAFEKLGLIRAEIVVAMGNTASQRAAEKIGAHYEGIALNRMVVRKEIHDAHMFSLLPSDFGLDAQL